MNRSKLCIACIALILTQAFLACEPKTLIEQELELQKQNFLLWQFPLPRTHTGALIGNGVQGLMIWGVDNQLNVTIGRAGFWDRRGGKDFLKNTSYQQVKELLHTNDQTGLREVFGMDVEPEPGQPERPHQIGGGRLEIEMPEGWKLMSGVLDLSYGIFEVTARNENGEFEIIRIRQSVYEETAAISMSKNMMDVAELRLIPSWEHVKDQLEPVGVAAPEIWNDEREGRPTIHGFIQKLPEDEPLAIGYKKTAQNRIIIGSSVAENAIEQVVEELRDIPEWQVLQQDIDWWDNYWKDVPNINLPNPLLQEIVNYGLYKQAIATPEHGIACSLQGPFNEEYQLPPWSNDYHYNINIEMIYLPTLATNQADHLKPVWDMILKMMPALKENGEHFFGREGALMLPHAVDDQGTVVGTFWTGTIDHACTAWMAQLAWLNYRYTMDEEILETVAWPLLNGAFEGYWAMMERRKNSTGEEVLSLPVSVSPEFRGSRLDAWGRDASFQLAAAHMIAGIMPKAAEALGKEVDARWQQVSEKLPKFATVIGPASLERPERLVARIALWEGMDLIESHRHHSHMAGIYPFDIIDPRALENRQVIRSTYNNWIRKGPGAWSGWCVPWASILHNRNSEPEAAVNWLIYWYRNFINEGRGTLHNAAFGGVSNISSPGWHNIPEIERNREVMQLDAGFGALSAVLDLLVHQKQGVVYVLPKIHRDWKAFDFEGIAVEGGFLISAKVADNKTQQIAIKSKFGGELSLAHGMDEKYMLNGIEISDTILELEFQPGEEVVLKRVNP
jgi:alpha-L-fucosidase 2